MGTSRGKTITIVSGVLVLILVIVGTVSFRNQIFERINLQKTTSEPGLKGQTVFITAGKIPVGDFIQFLSEFTGLPAVYDVSDQNIAKKDIQIVTEIEGADDKIVKAILEANGYRVFRQKLPGGKEVLKVERIQ